MTKIFMMIVTLLTIEFNTFAEANKAKVLALSKTMPEGFFRPLLPGWQDILFEGTKFKLRVNHELERLRFQVFFGNEYLGSGEASKLNPHTGKCRLSLCKHETRERRAKLLLAGLAHDFNCAEAEAEMLNLVSTYLLYVATKHYISYTQVTVYVPKATVRQKRRPASDVPSLPVVIHIPDTKTVSLKAQTKKLKRFKRGDERWLLVEEHYQHYHTRFGLVKKLVEPYMKRAGKLIPLI